MIKHVGRHNNNKVIVLFREVPDETHMCLVVYSDKLPTRYHDSIMQILESEVGQRAEPFADALHRNLSTDGRNLLGTLHHEGFIKKVQTSQVIMTPNAASQIRLDELNKMLNEMKRGEEAVKKMAELDANSGMKGSNEKRTKQVNAVMEQYHANNTPTPSAATLGSNYSEGVLDDSTLATSYAQQAERMEREAQSLLTEAARLREESKNLLPQQNEGKVAAKKTTRRVTNRAKKETAATKSA